MDRITSDIYSFGTDNTWNLEDELKLLDAINTCGLDNWDEIATYVPPFNSRQCEEYYYEKFTKEFEGLRKPPLCSSNCKIKLDVKDISEIDVSSSIHVWRMNQMLACMKWKDKTRAMIFGEFPHQKNPTCSIPCTGYSNIRSDFMVEYNDSAESILKLIALNQQENESTDEESQLISNIEYALLQSYNSCLMKRNYRKRIVRNHGLVDRRKTFNMLQRLEIPFGKQCLKVLLPLMRFMMGPEFDFLVERLKYQNELRAHLNACIDYRKNGLIYLNTTDIYKKLKEKRFKYNAELLYEASLLQTDEKSSQRKPSQPLALEHLPGYNLLNDEEKRLCSTSRIVPETYNSFKELLITECKKHNGLKLAQARNLIKIDVNKTRKIYDHLISLGLIWSPQE